MSEVKLLLDEHIPMGVVEALKDRNIGVVTVYDLEIDGCLDSRVLEEAVEQNRVIVTQDSDFLKLDSNEKYFGVLYLTKPLSLGDLTREIIGFVNELDAEDMQNSVVYIPL